jgi:hypothetical protein
MDVHHRAALELGADGADVTIINFGAGGLVVANAPNAEPGDLARVVITTATGRYVFPVQVLWQRGGSQVGFAFVGVPTAER